MTRKQRAKKEPIPCPFCREAQLGFTTLKNVRLCVQCPTCGACGPPATGATYGGVATDLIDLQTLAIQLWNFRLDARTASWCPDPKWRCIDCRVNWVPAAIARCDECARRRDKETT